MSAPSIPSRPARSQNQTQNPPSDAQASTLDPPQVPSRPTRFSARDASLERGTFSRSPLNELPASSAGSLSLQGNGSVSGLYHAYLPPNVSSLPLIGQEGSEYASLDDVVDNTTIAQDPGHTRNIHHDLPLHAPTASMAPVAAKSRIATVTRTDSTFAAEAGIGKPQTDYDEPDHKSMTTAFAGHRRSSSQVSTERRSSSAKPEEEYGHGIPMIGYQVPMYPNAGDVQAPSPALYPGTHSTGAGYLNDGSPRPPTTESRRRSAHNFPVPPGSYGLHGHGVVAQDQFEKAWYQKHPEEASKDGGAYGPSLHADRSLYSMSSEDLNNLVRQTSRTGSGLGTSADMISTPSEAIGYQATEEYAQKLASRPSSLRPSKSYAESFGHAESPLRRAVFPINDNKALDDTIEDDIIHVRPPSRNTGKITGGGYDPPTEDLGPHGGNTREQGGWINERGSGTPILASDEVSRDPAAEYRLPAVSPEQEKIGNSYFSGVDSDHPQPYQSGGSKSRSRSRPNAGHSALSRFVTQDPYHDSNSGTPLEEIEEYEPLFEDEEKVETKRPLTVADRLKRPNLNERRFPSQDVWEDTPNSLQLETTVENEQEPEESPIQRKPAATAASLFESPEKEAARKGEILESERLDFLNDTSKGFAKPKFRAHLQEEAVAGRPGMRQRFPSHDIWEDTPDSLRLETTVDEPQSPQDDASPVEARSLAAIATNTMTMQGADRQSSLTSAPPGVPARPEQSQESTAQSVPSIPARPSRAHQVPTVDITPQEKPSETSPIERKAPAIPDRPKPQVPARPARQLHDDQLSETPAPSVDVGSSPSDKSILAAGKPKPPVPSRPATGSSKIASLRAGFMNDLNSRLQLGPQAPAKAQPVEDAATHEEEEEKAPLADARKGRAKGPARRKPATTAAEEGNTTSSASAGKFSIAAPWTVWSIASSSSEADVHLGATKAKKAPTPTASQLDEQPTASPLARNTAGESLQPASEAPKTTSGALAHASNADMDERAQAEEKARFAALTEHREETVGWSGDVPEPEAEKPLSAYLTPLPQQEAERRTEVEAKTLGGTETPDIPGAFPEE